MSNSPQQNAANLTQALAAVHAHPMCAELTDDGVAYIVTYPAGDFPVSGVRAKHTEPGGKVAALGRMLERMERDWVESMPGHTDAATPEQP